MVHGERGKTWSEDQHQGIFFIFNRNYVLILRIWRVTKLGYNRPPNIDFVCRIDEIWRYCLPGRRNLFFVYPTDEFCRAHSISSHGYSKKNKFRLLDRRFQISYFCWTKFFNFRLPIGRNLFNIIGLVTFFVLPSSSSLCSLISPSPTAGEIWASGRRGSRRRPIGAAGKRRAVPGRRPTRAGSARGGASACGSKREQAVKRGSLLERCQMIC